MKRNFLFSLGSPKYFFLRMFPCLLLELVFFIFLDSLMRPLNCSHILHIESTSVACCAAESEPPVFRSYCYII